MSKRSLLLGAGHSRVKKLHAESAPDWLGELVTLDMNPNCGADVVWNLEQRPLPFDDESFDELAAYDVLEHLGKTGDWRGWFDEFAEYHRILKPDGQFGIIVPLGENRFADPGHTRFIKDTWFGFLNQDFYSKALADGQPVTDYRWYWKLNFEITFIQGNDHHLGVILQKF